jgi:hypothetical protein
MAWLSSVTPQTQAVFIREQLSRMESGNLLTTDKEIIVLGTLAVVLVVLWLLGILTSYTVGGLIHILLVIAIVAVLVRIIQGRNPLGV